MADRSVPVDDGCVQVGQELINIDAVNLGPDFDIVVTGPRATETRYAIPRKNRDGFRVGLDDVLDLHLLIDPHPSPPSHDSAPSTVQPYIKGKPGGRRSSRNFLVVQAFLPSMRIPHERLEGG